MNAALADRMDSLDESATLALNARAKELQKSGKTIYNLTAGELAGDTPEYIQTAVSKSLSLNKYTPVAGLGELRQAIAVEARQVYSLDWIRTENVVVTGGAKPALYTGLLALINPGDEVIIPTPAWVSYKHLVGLAGGTVVEVPLTEKFDLDPEAISAKLSPRTKAIILNSPHNPTGAVFSKAALADTAKIINDAGVIVISDDIYSKLVYDDDFTLVPTCGFQKLIIVNGFSKSQALTGWRIGYCIAETGLAKAVTKLLSHTMGNASLPGQHAGLAAMERHDRPPAETLRTLKRHLQLVDRTIAAAPLLSYERPSGAFYAFIDIRAITHDSAGWCEKLLNETGVALVPGEAFDAPGFVRLTFVTDEATLKKALELIVAFASEKPAA